MIIRVTRVTFFIVVLLKMNNIMHQFYTKMLFFEKYFSREKSLMNLKKVKRNRQ